MRTRAVLFDLDGTLVDSLPGIEFSVDCSLAECGLPARTRELRPLIGPPIRTILSQLLTEGDQQHLSRVEQAFRFFYDSAGWAKTIPAEGAAETLKSFHSAGLRLFVVTNKPAIATRQILEGLGIAALFSDVVCRNSKTPSFHSKVEMLEHITQMHQLEAKECLYVGDTSEDYSAARQVGMPVAIVAYGYGEPNVHFTECVNVDHLTELLRIVEAMEMP